MQRASKDRFTSTVDAKCHVERDCPVTQSELRLRKARTRVAVHYRVWRSDGGVSDTAA